MAKHTSGPWDFYLDENMDYVVVCVPLGEDIAMWQSPTPECIANAKLIAKAPQMLDLLDTVGRLAGASGGEIGFELWESIRDLVQEIKCHDPKEGDPLIDSVIDEWKKEESA